jgi:predicted MFS family arabinose efflux permease
MIPLLFLTVGLEFWQLLTLIFLGALLDMPGITARRSIYPDLAQLGGYQLERANAAYQMVNRMALLLGPPLAGFLIALIGPSNVLWFTGVTFAMSSLVVAGGVSSHLHFSQKADDAPPTRYAREVLEGFRFIWDDRTIFWMIMVLSVGSLLAEPLYTVVLPVYAREVFGSAVSLGIVFAGLAAGALAGNLFYAYRGYRLPRRTLFIGGFAARAALFWMITTQPSVVVLTVIMFLSGIVLEPVNPIQMTIMQERVPSTMRGRVFAASSAVAIGTMPIGMIGYGYLIEWVGLQTTLVVLASVNLALPMAMLAIPALREMEKPVESGPAVSEPVA